MTHCEYCLEKLGIRREHGSTVCSLRASLWCSQCGSYGHTSSECTTIKHAWRPRTLEELIPEDVRKRWGITTQTPILWNTPSLEDKEREIGDVNTIEIRHTSRTRDAAIREYMRANKISTDKRLESNIQRLREWAVERGKKLVLIQE